MTSQGRLVEQKDLCLIIDVRVNDVTEKRVLVRDLVPEGFFVPNWVIRMYAPNGQWGELQLHTETMIREANVEEVDLDA